MAYAPKGLYSKIRSLLPRRSRGEKCLNGSYFRQIFVFLKGLSLCFSLRVKLNRRDGVAKIRSFSRGEVAKIRSFSRGEESSSIFKQSPAKINLLK
jgi:hypothetical protein